MTTKPAATPKYERKWENVCAYTKRMCVAGGWLVQVWTEAGQSAICFMADADHQWLLSDPT